MSLDRQLPRVTPDDLETFKAEHFPCSGHPYAPPNEEYVDDYDDVDYHDDDDDDQLGYYPDGVKRTLTDDQIAMFRNSEIYALIRQKQVRKENKEAEFGPVILEAPASASASGATESKKVTTTTSITTHQHAPKDSSFKEGDNISEEEVDNDNDDEEEEYLRFLETEKRKAEEAAKKNNNSNERNSKRRKKTKADAHTHRRIARELDIVAVDEQMLDYDEGSSKKPPTEEVSKTAADSQQRQEDRLLLAKGGCRAMAAYQAWDRRPEGRKIWWPCIRED